MATYLRQANLPDSKSTPQQALSTFFEWYRNGYGYLAQGLSRQAASRVLMDLCGFNYEDIMESDKYRDKSNSDSLQTKISGMQLTIFDRKKQRQGDGIDISVDFITNYSQYEEPLTAERTALVEEALRALDEVPDVSLDQAAKDFEQRIEAERADKL